MICAGRVASTHGVRGCIRVQSYMCSTFGFVGAEVSIGGISYTVRTSFNRKPSLVVLSLLGVDSASEAESLVGCDVFVAEALLPPLPEDEYYYKDLIGMAVCSKGEHVGSVLMLYDFGAAAQVLEITSRSGKKIMIPFTKEFIVKVDLCAKMIEVILPEEV
ncbi:16S rRNA processing protein RimM [Neorickettsia helminthoeca str. Oregon]|uniref:Ribosome maturation factor RimM n=1 Tax=Neorickettsia helminthoeca str. Oregon TaxID=1286528 RepID=X5GVL1_9RICK|nr:ribosome maturation factor RimM [Neorickettsia helminthoeca]AHX11082.1 16S rRNA processing protein RimM [Neorickettsia helminthoeca str. Oregon]